MAWWTTRCCRSPTAPAPGTWQGEGARLVRDFPALRGRPPYPITSATAASLKTPHTLTVVRTHLAFVTDARKRGDEHGHLDWTPEISHPLSDGEKIITDALMHYTVIGEDQRTKVRAFVEVDRTTMSSERLASKLIEYARLWSYEPQPVGRQRSRQSVVPGAVWLRWYPVFPGFCSCSPEPPGTSWATGSATCRPWSPSTRSWARWPGRCRSAPRPWTTSNSGAYGRCLGASGRRRAAAVDRAVMQRLRADRTSQPCNCSGTHLKFAYAND